VKKGFMKNSFKIGKIKSTLNHLITAEVELRKSIWQRWNNPTGYTTPAFLVGNGRSGTSMIVRHLAKSWQIDLYNENNAAAFNTWFIQDLSVIEDLVRDSYASLALFKPLRDTYRTPLLLSRFPLAKVLFAFRHYDDVINSARKKFYDEDGLTVNPKNIMVEDRRPHVIRWVTNDFAEFSTFPPPEETKHFILSRWKPSLSLESNIALQWLFTNRLYFDYNLDRNNRVKIVRYESIVTDPVNEFKSLCQFLGLDYEPQIVKGIFTSSIRRDPTPKLDPIIRSDCQELWQRLCQQANLK
jgi:hypothetical protein